MLWLRRWIRIGTVGSVLFVAGAATVSGAAFVVTTIVWGLLGYFVLLGGIVARKYAT